MNIFNICIRIAKSLRPLLTVSQPKWKEKKGERREKKASSTHKIFPNLCKYYSHVNETSKMKWKKYNWDKNKKIFQFFSYEISFYINFQSLFNFNSVLYFFFGVDQIKWNVAIPWKYMNYTLKKFKFNDWWIFPNFPLIIIKKKKVSMFLSYTKNPI